jgi:hypothetical protein
MARRLTQIWSTPRLDGVEFPPPWLPPPQAEQEKRTFLEQHKVIISKIEKGQALSITARGYVAEALRQQWLPKHELRTYRQQQKLKHIEASKALAKYGVPFGKRTEFVQKATGYDDRAKALKQFVRRARKGRR